MKSVICFLLLLGMSQGFAAEKVHKAGENYKQVGRHASVRLVVVEPDVSEFDMKMIVNNICRYSDICIVKFWTDEELAATELPMTDAQLDSMFAAFNKNKNTGLYELNYCAQSGC